MKDIGSIFPLYLEDLSIPLLKVPNRMNFALCREAIYAVAHYLQHSNRKVLLPAYTCNTVYMPFEQLGWECIYYSVNRDLTIDLDSLKKNYEQTNASLVLFHPYFGKSLTNIEKQAIESLHKCGCKIIVDNTQCIFSTERLKYVDFYTGSYRKWFNISDGGFLECNSNFTIESPDCEYALFCTFQECAMYLRGEYFKNSSEQLKQLSIKLNKEADRISLLPIVPHRISKLSENILSIQDFDLCERIRFDNYRYLFGNLEQKGIKFVFDSLDILGSGPLYFPIYLENRHELQRYLAQHHIYLPVIWPVEDDTLLINDEIKFIYDHILCIPIDQRYDSNDMDKIVTLINGFYE